MNVNLYAMVVKLPDEVPGTLEPFTPNTPLREKILKATCFRLKVSEKKVCGTYQSQELYKARAIIYHLLFENSNLSRKQTAEFLGRSSKSTSHEQGTLLVEKNMQEWKPDIDAIRKLCGISDPHMLPEHLSSKRIR